MRLITSTVLLISIFLSWNINATEFSQIASQHQQHEHQHDIHRESEFKQTISERLKEKRALIKTKQTLQKEIDSLSKHFSHNEDHLAQLEEKLRLDSGSLGEIFSVVRQNAKEFQSNLIGSVTTADNHQFERSVNTIVEAKSLPSLYQLKSLWEALTKQIQISGEIKEITVPFVNHQGKIKKEKVIRVGNLAMVGQSGFLHWSESKGQATPYRIQPDKTPTTQNLQPLLSGKTQYLIIDPSKGTIIAQLENEPTFIERLKAGGVIGNIIIGLLIIGLLISSVRGVSLFTNKQKINHQLKYPNEHGDNPLGRVLSVYKKDEIQTVEALELRLLEAVIDEQSQLEKGLSMLKLLAALAPMLGLLGTVTGMIETFQVITMFGNGDPKIMAGGISMALITTVLGLVAAMPLLLAHNIISSQAESIRNILEKQGMGLVAAQAERDGNNKVLEQAA